MRLATLLLLLTLAVPAAAQYPTTGQSQYLAARPSYAQGTCPQCGRVHQTSNPGGAFNVVDLLNRQRAKMGLYPLRYDPQLQVVAIRRARLTAAPGRFRGHPAGSFSPARMEGVGYTGSSNPTAVIACGTYTQKFRSVGAAMVRGRGGCYFAVLYR